MSSFVLLKSDGSYEEIDSSKVERLVSSGFIVKSWEEMFKDTLDSTTQKIKDLEAQLVAQTNKAQNEERIRINYVDRTIELEAKLAEAADKYLAQSEKYSARCDEIISTNEKLKVAVAYIEDHDCECILNQSVCDKCEVLKKISEGN